MNPFFILYISYILFKIIFILYLFILITFTYNNNGTEVINVGNYNIKKSNRNKKRNNVITNYEIYNINNKTNINVCLCTIGKKENKYVREFVGHYKRLGVDKIFIYDNNDINDESFENVISDYIKSKYVELINYRGIDKAQKLSMNDCYNKNYLKYKWFIFYDMDEFLYLKNYTNIKSFLSENKFKKCKKIRLNLVYQTDNNFIFYQNESLLKRFPNFNHNIKTYIVKSILRGNISGIKIYQVHYLNKKIIGCNGFGNIVNQTNSVADIIDLNYFYIKHYAFKSTEEFINKILRGDAIRGFKKKNILHKIDIYFRYNKITLEKIIFIEKKIGIRLDKFKKKIKNL